MTERDPLLQEREKTHGSFHSNAEISQGIKAAYKVYDVEKDRYGVTVAATSTSWNGMKAEHKEALEMIALKASRILSGQANFKDHWDDIAGYAKLGAEACK